MAGSIGPCNGITIEAAQEASQNVSYAGNPPRPKSSPKDNSYEPSSVSSAYSEKPLLEKSISLIEITPDHYASLGAFTKHAISFPSRWSGISTIGENRFPMQVAKVVSYIALAILDFVIYGLFFFISLPLTALYYAINKKQPIEQQKTTETTPQKVPSNLNDSWITGATTIFNALFDTETTSSYSGTYSSHGDNTFSNNGHNDELDPDQNLFFTVNTGNKFLNTLRKKAAPNSPQHLDTSHPPLNPSLQTPPNSRRSSASE